MKEFIEKVKVTSLEIIVTGTKDKPYFEIKYKEVGKEDYNTGYSSYDLNNVFAWKEECFEIVNQLAEEYNNGWIPCSERLPKPGKRYLVSVVWKDEDYERPAVYNAVFGGDGLWHTHNYEPVSYEVIAWQPLPAPYQPKGENDSE